MLLSSPAKAGDPVSQRRLDSNQRRGVLDAPPSRGMTREISASLLIRDRLGEIARGGAAQIVDAFADADGVDRQQFSPPAHQDAAARGAVELGQYEAGDACGVESLDLRERFCPAWRRAPAAPRAAPADRPS